MTSGTPVGVQSRPPQRTIGGSGLSQRPTKSQRTLSQQYPPTSPTSAIPTMTSTVPGLLAQDDLSQQQKYASATAAAAARRGGSRLKLELSNDDDPFNPPHSVESPQNVCSSAGTFPPPSAISDVPCQQITQAPAEPLPPPYPMPRRRRPFKPPPLPQERPPASNASFSSLTSRRDPRPKPYNLDPPVSAPRFTAPPRNEHSSSHSSSGFADFFPWMGNHPEDQFNEGAIRQGYFEKGNGASESNGARDKLCPLLKHKSCLQQLSNVFSSVLLQRRQAGMITCPSSFKPPPRATLTDTKREMWLRELANPTVPLRKLSRTIPHGIRGRALLDQCLNKRIPPDRAVWLAKCVGANDIRQINRKGAKGTIVMGGEAKWVRDWTVFVEQFVEAVTSDISQPDWKHRVTYA